MTSAYVHTLIQLSLAEDIGEGDITSNNLIPADSVTQANLIAKAQGIICGNDIAKQVFKQLSKKISFKSLVTDGQPVKPKDVIARISGPSRAILSAERVALNFLCYLSGIATRTSQFVAAVKPYKPVILDTRKTTPLLRPLERYAVRMGGGSNHRFNLNDMAMIKDNHLVVSKSLGLFESVNILRKAIKEKIEVEADTLSQVKELLESKADIILLDNMTPKQIKQAVVMRDKSKKFILLEASGGITLTNIKKFAATGVDRISIGALTHTRQALDISLEFQQ